MFERLKAFFKKGGLLTESLNTPIDHPKIGVDPREYNRILENIRVYGCKFPSVAYRNSQNVTCYREPVPLNVVKFASNWMATLLYNEKCRINISDTNANEFIQALLLKSNFNSNFQKYLEPEYAIGGLAIRPYYSQEDEAIKISWCLPDRFFPLSSNSGEVSEAAFLTKTREVNGKKVYYYSLFEFHEWKGNVYVISNELYKSDDSTQIGKKVPLNTLVKYADLPEESHIEGLSRPLFVYLQPAQMNNIDMDSPLGVGMCDNARQTISTINLLHDKFWQNIRRARSGIITAPEYTRVRQENGTLHLVPDEDDIFLPVPGGINDEPFKEITIKINPDEFITAINFELRTFEAQTGFSAGTFGFDEASGLKTATEVVSEDSMTYQTRNKQIVVIEQALRDLVHSILELATAVGLYTGETNPDVTVDFDEGVFQDKGSQLDFYSKAFNSKLIPQTEAIKRTFNLTDKEAQAWVTQINAEAMQRMNNASLLNAGITFEQE